MQEISTQFIELRDTLAPTFVDNSLPTRIIDLPHNECTLDITELDNPVATDNCSDVAVRMDAVFRIENGTNWQIESDELTALDCDSFLVQWVAEDACHEQLVNDTISQLILIEDNTAPSAVCVDQINLSLGQNDAILHYSDIDGGSFDACGIVTYEVSRDEVNWDATVTFGCEDAHVEATVYLRVTDAKGNQSICWMTVNVEDKIAPICSDLPDMTENCDELHLSDLGASTDTNDNGLLDDDWVDLTEEQIELFNAKYGNPNCSDNLTCGELIIQQQYQLAAKECGRAAIQRRFRAIDWDGEGRTSDWFTQNINIESTENWSVTLPADWKGTCGDNIPSSELNIVNGACDLIAYEVEEEVFTITEDACLKVVRTFTIINWCNFEAGQAATQITRTENEHGMVTESRTISSAEFENIGKLEYIQILKLQNIDAEGMAVVSGTIMDWKQQTVEEVAVNAMENMEMMTQADGFYNFELPMNNPYTIQPQKNEQPLNGVSTFDLVLISKHILGITEFDNPYQMIAADANNSGSITAFDMVQLRQMILNIKTEFTNNESWRFVDAAYEFTTDQPLAEDFPEVIQITNLTQDMDMDFVAVKVGDVNGNASTNSLAQAEDRTTTTTFEITTEDQELKAGQTYTVEFNTTQLNSIQGYQFTLGYDDLKLEKLNSGVAGVDNFGLHKMDDGLITTSWNQSAVGNQQLTVDSELQSTVLFNIEFTALRNGRLSEQLNFLNRPTAIEAYNKDGNLMDVQLTFTTPLYDDQFELFQNQPNPFHDKTIIGFNLPGDSEIELILRDETGRVLKTFKEVRKGGYNTIQLEEELTNGFIYYQLSTKFGTKAKKMVQLK